MVNIRGAAESFIRSAISRGLGANETYNALRQAFGQAYRRGDFLADFRRIADLQTEMSGIRNLNRKSLPTDRLFKGIKPSWEELYEYRLRVTGRDGFTGERGTKYISYRSNERLNRDSLLERAKGVFNEGVRGGSAQFDIEDVLVVEGYRNARLS